MKECSLQKNKPELDNKKLGVKETLKRLPIVTRRKERIRNQKGFGRKKRGKPHLK